MRIFTSFYGNQDALAQAERDGLLPIRISLGTPRFPLSYTIRGEIFVLMPPRALLDKPKAQYHPEYIASLEKHGVAKIQRILENLVKAHKANGLVLLCYEDLDRGQWCHRTMFADWWMRQTGELVEELPKLAAKRPEPKPEPPAKPKRGATDHAPLFDLHGF